MKYTIITIDDSRAENKANIRANIELPEVTDIGFCDARVGNDMNPDLKLTTKWELTRGEQGIWHSNVNVWDWTRNQDEPLLVLEDDAIIDDSFMFNLHNLMPQIPEDYDFVSLWVPDDQEVDYYYRVSYDSDGAPSINGTVNTREESVFYMGSNNVARVYQGYSFVTTVYSPKGAAKIYDLAIKLGMYTPADCFLFHQAHIGTLTGYAPTPWYPRFIWHDHERESLKGI